MYFGAWRQPSGAESKGRSLKRGGRTHKTVPLKRIRGWEREKEREGGEEKVSVRITTGFRGGKGNREWYKQAQGMGVGTGPVVNVNCKDRRGNYYILMAENEFERREKRVK